MAKGRDPARDKAIKIYLEAKGSITNREIANKLDVDEKKIATWKYRDEWSSELKKNGVVLQKKKRSTTKKNTTMSAKRKKQIKKAKVLVESGLSLTEAAERTGTTKSTLGNHSAKEGWIDNRLANLATFHDEYSEEIIENKLNRLKLNKIFLQNVSGEIMDGKTSKTIAEKILINEQTEQLILEVDRMDKINQYLEKKDFEERKLEIQTTQKAIELELKHQDIMKDVTPTEENVEDGFLKALNSSAEDDWDES